MASLAGRVDHIPKQATSPRASQSAQKPTCSGIAAGVGLRSDKWISQVSGPAKTAFDNNTDVVSSKSSIENYVGALNFVA